MSFINQFVMTEMDMHLPDLEETLQTGKCLWIWMYFQYVMAAYLQEVYRANHVFLIHQAPGTR